MENEGEEGGGQSGQRQGDGHRCHASSLSAGASPRTSFFKRAFEPTTTVADTCTARICLRQEHTAAVRPRHGGLELAEGRGSDLGKSEGLVGQAGGSNASKCGGSGQGKSLDAGLGVKLYERVEGSFQARRKDANDIVPTDRRRQAEDLASLLASVRRLARAPISHFRVGAAAVGASGRIFLGVNLEFPGLPLHHTVHAEQFAVANAFQHGERKLLSLAISAVPCGYCRQFLMELRGADSLEIQVIPPHEAKHPAATLVSCVGGMRGGEGCKGKESVTLGSLLPNHFGPHDLLPIDQPLMLESYNHHLRIIAGNDRIVCDSHDEGTKPLQSLMHSDDLLVDHGGMVRRFAADADKHCQLVKAALAAANASYAPYTGCPSGVALKSYGGRIYAGSYMESAAYDPSLSPLQAALIALVAGGEGSLDSEEAIADKEAYSIIASVVLVEKGGKGGGDVQVRQRGTVEMALRTIAPRAAFHFYEAEVEAECN